MMRLASSPSSSWEAARRRGDAVRVVSINCAAGDKRAAAEVIPYHPDIVLLQETLERQETVELARRLFGKDAGIARGVGARSPDRANTPRLRRSRAHIARGRVRAVPLKGLVPFAFIQAHVRLTSGMSAEVFSVHFQPPVVRFDIWSPACWRDHAEKREVHREQARELAQEIASIPVTRPVIVGGDFNVPGGDGAVRAFAPRLRDTFKQGGRGWGDTVLNDMSVLRFDQIWASEQFRAANVVARMTKHSDHRMVIADLVLQQARD